MVASPLKRTINTALLSFEHDIRTKGLKVIGLPELQETSDLPCDTGSSPEELRKEFHGKPVDLHLVKHGWDSKKGKFAPSTDAIKARARDARKWLMSRPEKNIVVVTHGMHPCSYSTPSAIAPLCHTCRAFSATSHVPTLTRYSRRLSALLHRRLVRRREVLGDRLGQHRVPLLHFLAQPTRRRARRRDRREQTQARSQGSRSQRARAAEAYGQQGGCGEGE